MILLEPDNYGPVWGPLLAVDRRRSLGEGNPPGDARRKLKELSVEPAFGGKVADADMAQCCVAGIWLLYDFLDASHEVSQGISSREGSFWHGIMHRREGDFSNAKYWFRKVGRHSVWERLGSWAISWTPRPGESDRGGESASISSLRETLEQYRQEVLPTLVSGGVLDPLAFVDLCAAAQGGRKRSSGGGIEGWSSAFCGDLQQAEWELLFDFCYREALP
jgi:hypothetical protein